MYKIYTDASYCPTISGYACIVLQDNRLLDSVSGTFFVDSSIEAELFAAYKALLLIPSNSDGIIYSDLDGINKLLDMECSYSPKYKHVIRLINAELERTKLKFEFVHITKRSRRYKTCHKIANQMRKKWMRLLNLQLEKMV